MHALFGVCKSLRYILAVREVPDILIMSFDQASSTMTMLLRLHYALYDYFGNALIALLQTDLLEANISVV